MSFFYSKEKGFLNGEHRNIRLAMVSLLPFFFITFFIILSIGGASVIWFNVITTWISLFISGFGFTSNNKKWNTAAWISTLLLTLGSVVVGYYEYWKWASTRVGIGLLIFFTIIFTVHRFFR